MATETFKITVNRVKKINSDSNLKAFIDISIGGIVIKNFRVIDGPRGLFVGMPSEKSKSDNRWYRLVRFQNDEVRDDLCNTVLAAYSRE